MRNMNREKDQGVDTVLPGYGNEHYPGKNTARRIENRKNKRPPNLTKGLAECTRAGKAGGKK